MFSPLEFYNIAKKLYSESDNLDPGMARTCINRAYYAVFLVAREKANIQNTTPDIHNVVIKYYKKKDSPVGNRISDLFMKRKSSDYDLEDKLKNPITKRDSGIALKKAEEVLKYFKKI